MGYVCVVYDTCVFVVAILVTLATFRRYFTVAWVYSLDFYASEMYRILGNGHFRCGKMEISNPKRDVRQAMNLFLFQLINV